MSKKTFTIALAILFIVALVAPATFFIAPKKVSADSGIGCIAGLLGLGATSITSVASVPVSNLTIQSGTSFTAGATTGSCIYDAIIVPILRAMLRAFLQQVTKSTISWINGANGSGQPSFVQNLAVHLQSVGDSAGLSFISQVGANALNSPFSSSIASALQTNYSQSTSLAGFYAANQCTLSKSSPNINSFLAGNWSQGGIGAWFALTTQNQNNPYTLYQAAQSQMGSNVNQAQTNRRQDLIQSGGFLSWCPSGSTSNTSSGGGVKAQAPCTNANGTPVNASTPGSTIKSYLDANLGSGIGQLVSAQDLDAAINAIATALGNKIIGGTGLFGSSQPSSSSNTTIVVPPAASSAATSAISLAQSTLSNITTYANAWNTINTAANAASTNVTTLSNTCANQASAAQAALSTEIAPVLAQAQAASNSASTAQTLALQVQTEATNPTANPIQFSTDVTSLASMPPTSNDIISAQSNASVTGTATANPTGSLTVLGGSLVDQMNLISANATALSASCGASSTL